MVTKKEARNIAREAISQSKQFGGGSAYFREARDIVCDILEARHIRYSHARLTMDDYYQKTIGRLSDNIIYACSGL